LTDVIFA